MVATYKEALAWLYQFTNYEATGMPPASPVHYNLERMRRLLAQLGDPHKRLPHGALVIAGTKGKGSTAALCAAALGAVGLRVGLYSQPHLHTFRERMRIGNELIAPDEVLRLVNDDVRPAVERMLDDPATLLEVGRPTTYEVGTALALTFFAHSAQNRSADVAVLEIGLGGRLDAVNVVEPHVSVIASLSLDHVAVLGGTLERIAYEKAGIIKPGGQVIVAPQPPSAMRVIADVAAERGATLYTVGDPATITFAATDAPISDGDTTRAHLRLTVEHCRLTFGNRLAPFIGDEVLSVGLPLLGKHQMTNAALAAGALALLNEAWAKAGDPTRIEAEHIVEGFERVRWPGRFESMPREADKPLVIVDGAHNGESAVRLREALIDLAVYRGLTFVVGVATDKDIEAIFAALRATPGVQRIILTQARVARAATPDVLLRRGFGVDAPEAVRDIEVRVIPNVADALKEAEAQSTPADLVCVTGSLFVVAEAREAYSLGDAVDPL